MKKLERINDAKFDNLINFELRDAFKIKGGCIATGGDKGQSTDHVYATNPDENGMGKRDEGDGDCSIVDPNGENVIYSNTEGSTLTITFR